MKSKLIDKEKKKLSVYNKNSNLYSIFSEVLKKLKIACFLLRFWKFWIKSKYNILLLTFRLLLNFVIQTNSNQLSPKSNKTIYYLKVAALRTKLNTKLTKFNQI
jgi:hypothetical protein